MRLSLNQCLGICLPESDPEWILSKGSKSKNDDELKAAVSRLWPRVRLTFARNLREGSG